MRHEDGPHAAATPANSRSLLAILSRTPRRIAALSRGLGKKRLRRQPERESWSAYEILAHLRACADVWGRSLVAMIERDNPTLRYVSPRGHLRKTDYLTIGFALSLQSFTEQRAALVKRLRDLEPRGWTRPGTFTGTTRGAHQTILDYAARIADHEVSHLGQMERALSSTGSRRAS